RARFPAHVPGPFVRQLHRLPHERDLCHDVLVTLLRRAQLRGEVIFQRRVRAGMGRVAAEEVAEQERELLVEGASPANVDVCAPVPGTLPEVALGQLGTGTMKVCASLERRAKGVKWLK